jgi:Arm DNA-binding domain
MVPPMSLTASAVKGSQPKEKDYKLYDEKGLFLLVKANGAKYWRMKYRSSGKEKLLALGVFPEVTLAQARKACEEARSLLHGGEDPAETKKAQKSAKLNAAANSLEVVALEWFEKRGVKSLNSDTRIIRMIERDLFPLMGRRPISEITAPELLGVLRKIEARGAIDTAHRAKRCASQIFRYAIATGRITSDPSAGLKGALATPTKNHLAAITDHREVGKLLVAIDGYRGTPTVMAALKLSPLVFCRPGELRHLEWSEIN